ncbi:MAG: CPBP family glutamic-type intramembrane protease [Candidatus Eiseniibacteriota bacterium]
MSRSTRAGRTDLARAAAGLAVFCGGVVLTWLLIARLEVTQALDFVTRHLANSSLQGVLVVALPYAWAARFQGRPPAKLGLGRQGFALSFLLSCALYALALVAFLHCWADPAVADHPIRIVRAEKVAVLATSMCVLAATTDLATRGFVLLWLADCAPRSFAVLMQNVFWILGHGYEIRALSACLGAPAAYGLFLALGVLGDAIALRTRNVLGLALAHVLLNVVMILYLRGI